jgi:3-oxoacyl-[acyl-carrier-protein] synthase II
MKHALKDGKIDVERVDYVNAHATSTPIGDRQEQLAMRGVFGEHALGKKNPKGLWVSATKSMTGHLLGAAGGLEAAITALSMQHGIIPPTINLDDPDDDAKDFEMVAHEARQRKIDVAISNAFGFGGTNVTLAFIRHA